MVTTSILFKIYQFWVWFLLLLLFWSKSTWPTWSMAPVVGLLGRVVDVGRGQVLELSHLRTMDVSGSPWF